jgi:SSS family solute:Na+ symporter
MLNFNLILGLTACYFAIILGFVLYARYKSTNRLLPGLNEFFLAGKDLSPLVLTFTYIGSLFSTFTVLGMPGLTYTHGLGAIIFYILLHSFGVLLFLCVAKKMRRYAQGKRIFSPIEIISDHYNSRKLGFFIAVIFTIFLMPYISLQLVGIGTFITSFTDGAVTYTTGVGSMLFVIFIYLFLGGMRAVAYTDFVQIAASLIGLMCGLWLLLTHFDLSFFSVIQRINDISPDHLTFAGAKGTYQWPLLLTVSFITAAIYLQPHILTRAMMAKSDYHINFMLVGIIIGFVLTATLGLYYGLTIYLVYGPDLQPNFVMGHVFKEMGALGVLGVLIAALMLMGALGAAMSTADSLLISIGQIATRDMVRPFFHLTPDRQVVLSKVIMISVLITAFIVGLKPPQFMTDLAIYSAAGGAMIMPTILSFQWKHRSTLAGFVSITIGLTCLALAATYKIQTGSDFAGVHTGTFPLLTAFILYYGICFLKRR